MRLFKLTLTFTDGSNTSASISFEPEVKITTDLIGSFINKLTDEREVDYWELVREM